MNNQELSFGANPNDDEILKRFLSMGFAIVPIPELLQCAISELFASGRRFFAAPLEEKLRCKLRLDRGYRAYGEEYSASPEHPDEVESFTVGYRSSVPDQDALPRLGKTLYVEMDRAFQLLHRFVASFIDRVFVDITKTNQPNSQSFDVHTCSLLQMNYSRPISANSKCINDLHEDGCLVSTIATSSPGLEIQTGDGSFLPINTAPNEIVILAGEILWLLSNGIVRPAYHRVVIDQSIRERMSVIFFADLNPHQCSPWVAGNVNKNIDIAQIVLKSPTRFGQEAWSLDTIPPPAVSI